MRVCKIGSITLETPDIQSEVAHYTDLVGLGVAAREAHRVILSTSTGEEVLGLDRGPTQRMSRLSLQIDPNFSIHDIANHLAKHGLKPHRKTDVTPALSEVVEFEDPNGSIVQLFTEARQLPRANVGQGVMPVKLGHVAFMAHSAQDLVRFYTTVLGFRVSDWLQDKFAFLRCGPDHHTVNFMTGEQSRLHHLAFELRDWAHIGAACELLGRMNKKIIWGPGRHGIGHNIFIYHRDQDDHIVEFYCELDQMKSEALGYFEPRPWHNDFPQRPKVWERIPAALTWGPPPTEDFLRSHFQKTFAA